jgi:hypothetical protein
MTGTWHHYAGTYDGTTVSIYLDGVLVASSSYTGGAIALSGNDINIARNPAYGGDFFAGVLADVRLYGRALSASEIRTLFQLRHRHCPRRRHPRRRHQHLHHPRRRPHRHRRRRSLAPGV